MIPQQTGLNEKKKKKKPTKIKNVSLLYDPFYVMFRNIKILEMKDRLVVAQGQREG